MKKLLFLIGIISLLLIAGCRVTPPVIQKQQFDYTECGQNGYVANKDVNDLINISNRLVKIANLCTQNSNLTPLPEFNYLPEN